MSCPGATCGPWFGGCARSPRLSSLGSGGDTAHLGPGAAASRVWQSCPWRGLGTPCLPSATWPPPECHLATSPTWPPPLPLEDVLWAGMTHSLCLASPSPQGTQQGRWPRPSPHLAPQWPEAGGLVSQEGAALGPEPSLGLGSTLPRPAPAGLQNTPPLLCPEPQVHTVHPGVGERVTCHPLHR